MYTDFWTFKTHQCVAIGKDAVVRAPIFDFLHVVADSRRFEVHHCNPKFHFIFDKAAAVDLPSSQKKSL